MGEQISWQKIVAPGKKVLYFFYLYGMGCHTMAGAGLGNRVCLRTTL